MQQFIERNPVILGVFSLALLVLFAVLSLTLQRSDFSGGYKLTAQFTDANGLRVGDIVTVAGARAGRVGALAIKGDHVEIELELDGVELPTSTKAVISPRTLVGKRAVELETGDDFSQLLSDGDVIPLSQTVVYADVPEFGNASDELLSEVDAEALNTFLIALTDLTRGQRDEVAQLVEGGTRLTSVVNEQQAPLRQLLRRLRQLSVTLNSRDDELVAIVDDFDFVLGRLEDRRAEIKRLFRETRRTSAIGADLVAEVRPQLDAILEEVHRDAAILARHQMDIAEALAYAPDSIGGFASIAFSGDVPVPYGHVLVQSAGPAGVDVLAGCGGLLDQQLDKLLGPDPRTCEEQENDTFPDDTEEPDTDPVPDLPIDPPGAGSAEATGPAPINQTHRVEADQLARRLLPAGDDR